jgi:hypothetical protein
MKRYSPQKWLFLTALLAFGFAPVIVQAQTLSINGSATGMLDGNNTSATYSVTIPADGDITFTAQPTAATLRMFLTCYDTDGTTEIASSSIGGFGVAVNLSVPHLGPGTYYVTLSRYEGSAQYRISDTFARQTVQNDTEPNDTLQTAQSFSSSTGHLGYSRTKYADIDTVDYYALTGSGALSVTAQPTSALRISLALYNAGGGGVASVDGSDPGAAATLAAQNLPPGTYYLAVSRGEGYGAYTFSGAVPVSISGTITLQSCQNPKDIPLRFRFRPTDGTSSFDLTAVLAADGSYTIPGVLPQKYDLAIKGGSWLQKVLSGIDASGGSVTGVNATLLPGDINNDNKVNISDLGLLADAFNSDPTGPKWNVNADLNRDGKVNIADLGLLADSFGKNGDP